MNVSDSTTGPAITAELEQALVSAFLENAPDIVYFKDRESRFIAVSHSKARRHDLAPADLVGRTDFDLFTDAHAQAARRDEERIMETVTPMLGQLERTQWIDGREGWTEVTKLPLQAEDGTVLGTFGISTDVTGAEQLRQDLERTKRHILDASRTAGMAEVATGVLHNVGNVLNSLNVSANVIAHSLRQSRADSLAKLASVLADRGEGLGEFVARDPKGRRVPEFIESLARHWLEERERILQEIVSLQENIDHIKEIVTMQQAYATMLGAVETLDPAKLMEDAFRMNAGALVRHKVTCVRDYQTTRPVVAEKAKVLQILINLIRNAKYATDEGRADDRIITLRLAAGKGDRVRLVVEDNGVGISPANLARLFTHGFTTRAGGHGFGLHSSLAVAREMNGDLTAHSAGIGHGATFTLELPAASEGATAAPGRALSGADVVES